MLYITLQDLKRALSVLYRLKKQIRKKDKKS